MSPAEWWANWGKRSEASIPGCHSKHCARQFPQGFESDVLSCATTRSRAMQSFRPRCGTSHFSSRPTEFLLACRTREHVASDLTGDLSMSWAFTFLLGVLCGAIGTGCWTALRNAWLRVNHLEVSHVEIPPLGPPRAFVRSGVDEYYVRQVVPGGRSCWFREDTGDPVSEALERRLHVLIGMAWTNAKRTSSQLQSNGLVIHS